MAKQDSTRIDEPTGTEFVGHEWDGIEELDTPMPRWWLWTFYATIVWALGYVVLYPAWPMLDKATEGVLGWTSRGDLARDIERAEAGRADFRAQLDGMPIENLPQNAALMQQAVAGGEAAFKVNCVQCHGAGAAGYEEYGYPNLNDDDWIWGGNLKEIEYTLLHGIRWAEDKQTRMSLMPAFEGILTGAQVNQVVDHVLSLSGNGQSNAAGAQAFETNCAVCHGPTGAGDRSVGAPALNDAIWLYGSERAQITQQILAPRHGVMPGWGERLDPVTIKMLAAYVHSRGGGEAMPEATESETDSDAPPAAGAETAGNEPS